MTVTNMYDFIKRRLDDATGTRWDSTTDLLPEINNAYRHVTADAEILAVFPRLGTAQQTLTIVSGTLAYALNANFQYLRDAIRTDTGESIPCTEINEAEYPEWAARQVAFDAAGRPVFYLSTNSTPVHTFNFPYDPQQAMTIVVDYFKSPTALSSGSDVPDMPTLLHELIPLHVCSVLPDVLDREAAASEYAIRKQQAIEFLRHRRGRRTISLDPDMFC